MSSAERWFVTLVMMCVGERVRMGSWALGELDVTLGRATLWVRTRRYDTVAKAGVARHIAALRGIAPPQVDLLRIARARSLAPTVPPGRHVPLFREAGERGNGGDLLLV